MITHFRWSKNLILFGGAAVWGIMLVGCVAVNRSTLAPGKIPNAKFSGTKECIECHADQTGHFDSSTHAKVALATPAAKPGDTGCETCHGGGSLHVQSGGAKGTIVNPKRSPEACFQCHLDKRGTFALPNSHAVNAGNVTCADCHDPHTGNVLAGTGASLEAENETCTKCHTQQKGPFVFAHNAMKEGCTACHNPHGSVNPKMLVARDANLCLRCHLQTTDKNGTIFAGGEDHRTRLQNGTCWSAGCHEAVHGSNTSKPLRY